MNKSFFPFFPLSQATRCPALFIESGIAILSIVKPSSASSFVNNAPTFFIPSLLKVPLLIFTDAFSYYIVACISASIFFKIYCSFWRWFGCCRYTQLIKVLLCKVVSSSFIFWKQEDNYLCTISVAFYA